MPATPPNAREKITMLGFTILALPRFAHDFEKLARAFREHFITAFY